MAKKQTTQNESLFGYKLVERKPRMWVVVAVITGLVLFFGYFYSLVGASQPH